MGNINYIIVGNFHSSGSSAIVDLLKEYNNFYECDAEIRFVTDPHGIIQLERALTDDWDWISSSIAINDFLSMSKKYAKRKTFFPLAPFGMGYKRTINKNYLEITEQYIRELSDGEFISDCYYIKSQKKWIRYVIERCIYALEYKTGIRLCSRRRTHCFYSHPTKERFYDATRTYFDRLFAPYQRDNEDTFIILDQALSPNTANKMSHYFSNAKMIIAERDIRDIYIDDVSHSNDLNDKQDIKTRCFQYAEMQRAMRERIPNDSNILKVRFEDLILHYDETVNTITDFIGISEEKHSKKRAYLNPYKSIKNVGQCVRKYRQYHEQVDELMKLAPELTYDFDREWDHIERMYEQREEYVSVYER